MMSTNCSKHWIEYVMLVSDKNYMYYSLSTQCICVFHMIEQTAPISHHIVHFTRSSGIVLHTEGPIR